MGPTTRKNVEHKFGGTPKDLPEADLPTLRDIVRFIHKLDLDGNTQDIVNCATDRLLTIWEKVNPRLVLLSKKTITVI